MTQPLPEFDNPPLIEVAFSVQFEELGLLRVPQLGYVWHAFRDRFPKVEEQPPLEKSNEQFGPKTAKRPRVRLELSTVPPRPRLWFLNDSGSELVQVQSDRFVRNWRKQEETAEYPRYSRLRGFFQEDFEVFSRLIEAEQWGVIEPNQCEVTYVNVIPAGEGWREHGELDRVITVFLAHYSDDKLGKPEEAAVNLQYVLKDDNDEPVGRLHIEATPVFRVSDNCPSVRLVLTARGKPLGSGIEGVMQFLDRGHEAIVRGFASVTTKTMHEIWKRTS